MHQPDMTSQQKRVLLTFCSLSARNRRPTLAHYWPDVIDSGLITGQHQAFVLSGPTLISMPTICQQDSVLWWTSVTEREVLPCVWKAALSHSSSGVLLVQPICALRCTKTHSFYLQYDKSTHGQHFGGGILPVLVCRDRHRIILRQISPDTTQNVVGFYFYTWYYAWH